MLIELILGKGNKLILRTGKVGVVNDEKLFDKIHQISSIKYDENSYLIACSAGRQILITKIIDNAFQTSFVTKFSDWISSIKVSLYFLQAIIKLL